MLFDPAERNVDPFLFPTGIRTMKKLVLTSAIHNKYVTMAEAEQLEAHKNAVTIRLKKLNEVEKIAEEFQSV